MIIHVQSADIQISYSNISMAQHEIQWAATNVSYINVDDNFMPF